MKREKKRNCFLDNARAHAQQSDPSENYIDEDEPNDVIDDSTKEEFHTIPFHERMNRFLFRCLVCAVAFQEQKCPENTHNHSLSVSCALSLPLCLDVKEKEKKITIFASK